MELLETAVAWFVLTLVVLASFAVFVATNR